MSMMNTFLLFFFPDDTRDCSALLFDSHAPMWGGKVRCPFLQKMSCSRTIPAANARRTAQENKWCRGIIVVVFPSKQMGRQLSSSARSQVPLSSSASEHERWSDGDACSNSYEMVLEMCYQHEKRCELQPNGIIQPVVRFLY